MKNIESHAKISFNLFKYVWRY